MRKLLLSMLGVVGLVAIQARGGDGTVHHPAKPVPGEYIVQLDASLKPSQVESLARGLAQTNGATIDRIRAAYAPSFVIKATEAAANAIAKNPNVLTVEQNGYWDLAAVDWHLDRLDQRYITNGLDNKYVELCPGAPKTNVVAFVIDTGIKADHQEFQTSLSNLTTRVIGGVDFVKTPVGDVGDSLAPCRSTPILPYPCGSYDPSCNNGGHGTAVASVLGGLFHGVRKDIDLVSVRTGSCSGNQTTQGVSAGLQWVIDDPMHLRAGRPAIINISAGLRWAEVPPYWDTEMERLIDVAVSQNIVVVVAAGNNNDDVFYYSPARKSFQNGRAGGHVIAAGGTDIADRRWVCNPANWYENCAYNPGSNWGNLDIFAPAQNITSAGIKTYDPSCPNGNCYVDAAPNSAQVRLGGLSGTSFSSPAVAGMAAFVLSGYPPGTFTPDQVWNTLLSWATPGVLTDVNGSPNRMLYREGPPICRSGITID